LPEEVSKIRKDQLGKKDLLPQEERIVLNAGRLVQIEENLGVGLREKRGGLAGKS